MLHTVENQVNSVEKLQEHMDKVRKAQEAFAVFTQEKVDEIFKAAAIAANKARISLAKDAVNETGMGLLEDKIIKNHFASEYIYNKYKNSKTCGIIKKDEDYGMTYIAEPMGLICGVIPTTNPTSTAIFKTLMALKTRNGIILSPHPRAKKCTIDAANIVLDAAVKAGAPEGIIDWIDDPSLELTNYLMQNSDIILATGGPGLVHSAYSSGKPALGVGSGNTPAIIDDSADIVLAVNSIIHSKTFDNGLICASEQSVTVLDNIYDDVKNEFVKRGCYILNQEEKEKVAKTIIINGAVNAKIVGQPAYKIAELSGISVPKETKILIGEVESTDLSEEFSHEKLSPVLAMYHAKDFDEAMEKAYHLVFDGGIGHTSSIYVDSINQKEKIDKFASKMKTCRVLVNTPSSHGGIGDLYNFKLEPSLTLGCGSWGGNSISGNLKIEHLLNIKSVAERRNNMLWFRAPEKVYMKQGSIPVALEELKNELHRNKVFIVTDQFLFSNGYTKVIEDKLHELGIQYDVFADVTPNPKLSEARTGVRQMNDFAPDTIIAVGGGSAMDAAKIMWVMYEHPELNFEDMAMDFMDIRKRVYTFPHMGDKAYFIAIPTSSGTGSEVTPFAIITDEDTGLKYPIADYELLPDMAIVDVNILKNAPKGLTAASGIDAVTHCLEALASMMSTPFTDGIALEALKMLFDYLPRCYQNGQTDLEAREMVGTAATMAGMASANAFLGIGHSLAHKLGAYHNIVHGIANALVIDDVIRFNSVDIPTKMGTFPQYDHPMAIKKYVRAAEAIGVSGNSDQEKVEGLIKRIDELKEQLEIKKTLQDYGVSEEQFWATLDEMSENAFDDQCTSTNPRYPLIEEMKTIYIRSFYGNEYETRFPDREKIF